MVTFNPIRLDPPHKVTSPEHVWALQESMEQDGWIGEPLVGYIHNGRIQLLSGTHRRAAAIMADIKVPVIVRPFSQVQEAYGDLDKWKRVMSTKQAKGVGGGNTVGTMITG